MLARVVTGSGCAALVLDAAGRQVCDAVTALLILLIGVSLWGLAESLETLLASRLALHDQDAPY